MGRIITLRHNHHLEVFRHPDSPTSWVVSFYSNPCTHLDNVEAFDHEYRTVKAAMGTAIADLLTYCEGADLVPPELYPKLLDADPDAIIGGRRRWRELVSEFLPEHHMELSH